jgi:hypothetical protein
MLPMKFLYRQPLSQLLLIFPLLHTVPIRHVNRVLRYFLCSLQGALSHRLRLSHQRHTLHCLPSQLVQNAHPMQPHLRFIHSILLGMRMQLAVLHARAAPWAGPRPRATLQWGRGRAITVSRPLHVCQERTLPRVMKMKPAGCVLRDRTLHPMRRPRVYPVPCCTPRRPLAAHRHLLVCP